MPPTSLPAGRCAKKPHSEFTCLCSPGTSGHCSGGAKALCGRDFKSSCVQTGSPPSRVSWAGYVAPTPPCWRARSSPVSRRPAHPHSALQSGPGPTPHPHTSQGHRGYLADSICILFVLLRIPTLPQEHRAARRRLPGNSCRPTSSAPAALPPGGQSAP